MFSFTRCLEIAVHNVRIDSLLYLFYLVTDYLISFNFTSLSFLKLVNELFFFIFFPNYASDFVSSVSHYLKVTPSLLTRLPLSRKKYFEELLCNLRHCTTVYAKKTFTVQGQVPCNSPQKLVSSTAPKRRCSSHTFRYGYLVTT